MEMTPAQFRAWRKGLGLKQKGAADLLGLKKRMIQYYETGVRDGKKVKIPKTVRLACFALVQGVIDFDGAVAEFSDAPPASGSVDALAEASTMESKAQTT